MGGSRHNSIRTTRSSCQPPLKVPTRIPTGSGRRFRWCLLGLLIIITAGLDLLFLIIHQHRAACQHVRTRAWMICSQYTQIGACLQKIYYPTPKQEWPSVVVEPMIGARITIARHGILMGYRKIPEPMFNTSSSTRDPR